MYMHLNGLSSQRNSLTSSVTSYATQTGLKNQISIKFVRFNIDTDLNTVQ